jgi:hypothetical protein
MSNAGGMSTVTRYTDMLAGNTTWNPWQPDGAYDALATVTVPAGGLASVTFAAIPNTYKHLQLRYTARDTFAATWDVAYLTFNGASSGYSWHELIGNGSTTPVAAGSSQSFIRLGRVTYASSTANVFAGGILDVLDYANTSKNKTTRLLAGADLNGDGFVLLDSGLYQSTSAITSMTITAAGTAFAQNSQFSLYGVK